mmetsp:Transcript_81683/g.218585  ORF Transcript_81683/g.218585 Transcript_81683/m.218585 type:complete len:400 (-) Transcript_81683:427-1626(-)
MVVHCSDMISPVTKSSVIIFPYARWYFMISEMSARARTPAKLSSPKLVAAASKAALFGAKTVYWSVPFKRSVKFAASSADTKWVNPSSAATSTTVIATGMSTTSILWITPLPAMMSSAARPAPSTVGWSGRPATVSWATGCKVSRGDTEVRSAAMTFPGTTWYFKISGRFGIASRASSSAMLSSPSISAWNAASVGANTVYMAPPWFGQPNISVRLAALRAAAKTFSVVSPVKTSIKEGGNITSLTTCMSPLVALKSVLVTVVQPIIMASSNIKSAPCTDAKVLLASPEPSISPATIWYSRISLKSGRSRKSAKSPSPRAKAAISKASLRGAKRVYLVMPFNSGVSPALATADTRWVKPWAVASSTSVGVGASSRTASTVWTTPFPLCKSALDTKTPST